MNHLIRSLIFLTLMICLNNQATAQNWVWMKGAQNGESRGQYIATGTDGSVYATGLCWFTGNFGPYPFSTSTSVASMPVIKYDSSGAIQWMILADRTSPAGITTDLFGNIYVLATYFDYTVSMGTHTLSNPHKDSGRYFIAKITSSGSVRWLKELGNSNAFMTNTGQLGNRIKTDECGNIYVSFPFAGSLSMGVSLFASSGWADMALAKFDSSGNLYWVKGFGGNMNDLPSELVVASSGSIYVAGMFNSDSLRFGSTVLTDTLHSTIRWNCFLTKFDAFGNVLWSRTSKNTTDCELLGICLDKNENIFATGGYGVGYYPPASPSFDTVTLDVVPTFSYYGFIIKYDINGNPIWGKTMRGKNIISYAATVDPANNVWLHAANFSYTFNTPTNDTIDGHIVSAPAVNASPNFISGWSNAGTYISTSMLQSGTNSNVSGIASDRGGNVYITCLTQIDTFIVANDSLYNTTGPVYLGHPYNMYIAKYNPNLSVPYDPLSNCSPQEIPINNGLIKSRTYPNPTNGSFYIETSMDGILLVYSIAGKCLFRSSCKKGITEVSALEHMPPGAYYIRIQNNDGAAEFLQLFKR